MAIMTKRLIVRYFVVVFVAVYVVNSKLAVMLWNKATFLTDVFLMKYPGGFYGALGNFVFAFTTVKELAVSLY